MGDVVGHKEYSNEGKIDPAGIDMPSFRRDVQKIIDNPPGVKPNPTETPGGASVTDHQIAEIHNQVGVSHPVRQVFQKLFYNTKDGKLWTRAGLADIFNEVVWDGFINPVDLFDGKDDPDAKPDSVNKARRGSLMSYVLGTYRDAALARRNTDEILKLLKAGK
ncbi:hypothetical protein R3Q06_17920 [Rhodococcus erythropolis]|uniref:hypothetical protein n=1 Tax=Rhodococcus erythropolis TaxID=1833 RepID=UPI00294A0852|nr:hypothetical protein [Rhodococcus erythropolis]MDV6275375.1 hypothetical protein [Rhodococcus erythropolis]